MSESYIHKQLDQIDLNINEVQRLIRVQNEHHSAALPRH